MQARGRRAGRDHGLRMAPGGPCPWPGKAQFPFPRNQSQLALQGPPPQHVQGPQGLSLGFGLGPEALLDHTESFGFIIVRVRGNLFLVP